MSALADKLIPLQPAVRLKGDRNRLFIGAGGFETRSMGWARLQRAGRGVLAKGLCIKYHQGKGPNKDERLRARLRELGARELKEVRYDVPAPHDFEDRFLKCFRNAACQGEEVVLDVTAMTKYAILVTLCCIREYDGPVRIVYSQAEEYGPTWEEYCAIRDGMMRISKVPSYGVETILRARCMSSIRMQGHPVVLVAFTSFNEQLVRHMLGTLTPHVLVLINGTPPSRALRWREKATQEIHEKIRQEFAVTNPVDKRGRMKCRACTLDYTQTLRAIERMYCEYGMHKRIVCAATGSKMQTVGLFVAKTVYPDMHIEYPSPDSVFHRSTSRGVKCVHELHVPNMKQWCQELYQSSLAVTGQPEAISSPAGGANAIGGDQAGPPSAPAP